MNHQQWLQYGTFSPQNDDQHPPSLDLSLGAVWPTENLQDLDPNRPVSTAYGYDDSWSAQALGWMTTNQNFDMPVSSNEVIEDPNVERVIVMFIIAIQLYLALVTNTINTPGLISEVELEVETHSITERSGIFEISVRSIVSLTGGAYLPLEFVNALQNSETGLATAQNLPSLLRPIQTLADFRLLAPTMEILINPRSDFLLRSVPNINLPYVVESERPKFVLILLQGLMDWAFIANSAFTAFQSEPANPDVFHADRSSDHAELPFELANPNHEEANGSASETSPVAFTQIASPVVPHSSALEVDGVGPRPTLQNILSVEFHIPIRARDIAHACEIIGILELRGTPKSTVNNKRSFSEIVQDWYRAWKLTLCLGYDETKGDLDAQMYMWENGHSETFEQILNHVNWKRSDYEQKTSLYTWAINATSTKVWNTAKTITAGQEDTISDAKQTWNRLSFFFQSTSYLSSGNPRSARPDSREYDLTYLHQSEVRRDKPHIKKFLIDRPEFSA
ncbi:hypothetical protein FB446DRAFT_793987 [Lentinula raphanica]|nr:hypothetical protein FB446DRAFT_793987 [Lentinula raphanica]